MRPPTNYGSTYKPVSSNQLASAVVDSVTLHYFLLVGRAALLIDLLGSPLRVPRIVYDPDEPANTPPTAMSEIRRAIDYHDRRAADRSRQPHERTRFETLSTRLQDIDRLYATGQLDVLDMNTEERALFSQLTSAEHAEQFGLTFPLDAGEAACVSIAHNRDYAIATDDGDALKALHTLSPRHPYERIRKLLIRAATSGLISEAEANAIHSEITQLGFWDRKQPFPARR